MSARKAYDEACEWIVRLDSGTATAAERARFVRWLNREPENAVAYEEMSQIWARMDTLGVARADQDAGPAVPAGPWPRPPRSSNASSQSFRNVVLASLACIALIVAFVLVTDPRPAGHPQQEFVTGLDEGHLVIAPDGSEIDLLAHTAIAVEYSVHSRQVRFDRGEAVFRVIRNEAAPFVITAGQSTVQVVGTEFRLFRNGDRIELAVTDGSVAFRPRGAAGDRSGAGSGGPRSELLLTAGQSLVYHAETGAIEFSGQSL